MRDRCHIPLLGSWSEGDVARVSVVLCGDVSVSSICVCVQVSLCMCHLSFCPYLNCISCMYINTETA